MTERQNRPTCILMTGINPYRDECARLFARQVFDVLAVVSPQDSDVTEASLVALKPDFVISFTTRILRGPLLDVKNVNFHPAPPERPGRGGASLAIYDGDQTYGATAHVMVREVDAGPILAVKRFPILPAESCQSLFRRAELASLDLFYEILTHISRHGELPPPSGDEWQGKAMTRKEFKDWLVLNPEDTDDFHRKIKAARHPDFPGPYVIIHGHKFGFLANE